MIWAKHSSVNEQIVMYLFSRILVGLCKLFAKKGVSPFNKWTFSEFYPYFAAGYRPVSPHAPCRSTLPTIVLYLPCFHKRCTAPLPSSMRCPAPSAFHRHLPYRHLQCAISYPTRRAERKRCSSFLSTLSREFTMG
jgi:hypothetical protein